MINDKRLTRLSIAAQSKMDWAAARMNRDEARELFDRLYAAEAVCEAASKLECHEEWGSGTLTTISGSAVIRTREAIAAWRRARGLS